MHGFNRGTILSTAIHEAYPGHYVQFLWMQHVDSRVRKLLGANSNAEGWAHYCEQMMLDEGVSDGSEACAWASCRMRCCATPATSSASRCTPASAPWSRASSSSRKKAIQTHEVADRETKRGTSDPTYLYYTLGKLQILKLREDYRKMKGAKFSLEEFHDAFMKQGFPPIKIVRRALLGNDSPTL